MMSAQNAPTMQSGFTSPCTNDFIRRWLSYKYADSQITNANFAMSLGCIANTLRSIHLCEPLTSFASGEYTASTSNTIDTAANGTAIFLRNFKSTNAAKNPAASAIKSHMACLRKMA